MSWPLTLTVLLAMFAICAPSPRAFAKDKPVVWKVIEDALLRVNDVPVKDWTVYRDGRKNDPLLLQIGTRFLLIEVHQRRLFEVDGGKVEQRPSEVVWDPADHDSKPLATSEWLASDFGAAFRIVAKIDPENRLLSLELPHPPDVGDLPARAAAPARRRSNF